MSHFTACAIFKLENSAQKDRMRQMFTENKEAVIDVLQQKLEKPMSRYDINLEIKPYKVYPDQKEIEEIKKYYNISATDLSVLIPKMENWNGNKGYIDEQGKLYYITTQNFEGHFDYWGIYDILFDENFSEQLITMNVLPAAFLLPDVSWVQSEDWFYSVAENNEGKYKQWENKVADILSNYKSNSVAVLIDCHI